MLSEFDQGKRSCRKRLADHNRRRRKSQDLSTPSAIINSQISNNKNEALNAANNNISDNKSTNAEKPLIAMTKPEPCSSVTHASSESQHLAIISAPPMALGLGCGAIPAATVLSASSSTGTSPPQSVSFLSQLGEFRGADHRFPSWDETEDGSSIRGLYQNK